MLEEVKRYECKCKRCGWIWLSREEHPIACARCKNSYWSKEPIVKKEAEATVVDVITPAVEENFNEVTS